MTATAAVAWPQILEPEHRPVLGALLLAHVRQRRWFRAKARALAPGLTGARVIDVLAFDSRSVLAILRIAYDAGEPDLYAVPLARVDGIPGAQTEALPIVATLVDGGALIDGLLLPDHAAEALLAIVVDGRTVRGDLGGSLWGEPTLALSGIAGRWTSIPRAGIARIEQTNSTAVFDDQVLLKIYRQLTAGINPELEVGRFLTRHLVPHPGRSLHTPRVLGALWYRAPDGAEASLGIAHEFLANDGDAFSLALAALRAELARTTAPDRGTPTGASIGGDFVKRARTLGRRTGELHLVLGGADVADPDFGPRPLSADARAGMVIRVEAMLAEQLAALSRAASHLSAAARRLTQTLQGEAARTRIAAHLTQFRDCEMGVVMTRTHGDLHLGQVLVRGEDLVIIDFEGEPARPLAERRARSSPLRDVMGMVRSFDYVPEVLMRDPSFAGDPPGPDEPSRRWLDGPAARWKREVTASYLQAYLDTVGRAPFIPASADHLSLLLTFHRLEKVVYEIAYELNNRPDWVEIPLQGLAAIVDGWAAGRGS